VVLNPEISGVLLGGMLSFKSTFKICCPCFKMLILAKVAVIKIYINKCINK
jgi:hypothetical protein